MMTVQEFKAECKPLMAAWDAEGRENWTVDYLLCTLRHLGPAGDDLRLRALKAGL